MWFPDRADAGRRLAQRLDFLQGHDVVVLGLARGGVPVAYEVAVALSAPLDVVMTQKFGQPCQPDIQQCADRYRAGRPRIVIGGRTAVVVDDGAVTGADACEACRAARAQGAGKVVVALPVAAPAAVRRLDGDADDVICLCVAGFSAVGEWYEDYRPVRDFQIVDLLTRAALPPAGDGEPPG